MDLSGHFLRRRREHPARNGSLGETDGTAEDPLTAQFRACNFCLDRLSELWYKQTTF
jgi:hypothetical protein